MVRYCCSGRDEWRQAVRSAQGSALLMGIIFAGGSFGLGLLVGGSSRAVFFALSIALPGLVVQDGWRYAFFAAGRPKSAFVNDAVWAAVQFGMLVPVLIWRNPSTYSLVLLWGASAGVAAIYGAIQSGVFPRPRLAFGWLREQSGLSPYFLADFAAANSSNSAAIYATAAASGLLQAGSFRAAQVLVGPARIFSTGLASVSMPEAGRALRTPMGRPRQAAARLSAVTGGIAIAWAGVLIAMGDSMGRTLLGESSFGSRRVAVFLALALAGAGLQSGPQVVLKALEAAKGSLKTRAVSGGFVIVGAIWGALLDGAVGAALGFAVGNALSAIIWWRALLGRTHSPGTRTMPIGEPLSEMQVAAMGHA